MVLFAAFMMWAYTWTEYTVPGKKTSIWKPLWDSINYSKASSHHTGVHLFKCPTADFAVEIIGSLKYYLNASRGKPGTRVTKSHPDLRAYNSWTGGGMAGPGRKMDFATAFGVYQPRAETDRQSGIGGGREPQSSYDEAIRLAPYGYQEGGSLPEPDPSASASFYFQVSLQLKLKFQRATA